MLSFHLTLTLQEDGTPAVLLGRETLTSAQALWAALCKNLPPPATEPTPRQATTEEAVAAYLAAGGTVQVLRPCGTAQPPKPHEGPRPTTKPASRRPTVTLADLGL